MARHFIYLGLAANLYLVGNPTGPTVVEGGALFTGLGTSSLTVTSTATTTAIDWTQFSINSGEAVTFQRSGSSSDYYVLNTVPDSSGIASALNGVLMTSGNAIGHIYLVNPAGITIGSSGVIIAGSFLASTLDLVGTFDPFNNMEFTGSSQTTVTNAGSIQVSNNDAILIGYRVINSGSITSADGVCLGAGVDIIVQPGSTDRIYIQASGAAGTGTGIISSGIISAEEVVLKADGNPYTLAINHSGTISLSACGGSGNVKIVAERLSACTGAVQISGTVQRSVTSCPGSPIIIDGETIALQGATLNTSGTTGAGSITIGNLSGLCPTSNIYIDANTNIIANATTSGTGGTISIVADNSLLFLGALQSGGVTSGGAVSLASNGYLGVVGNANVGGLLGGTMGTLSLTNSNILLGGTANNGSNFAPPNYVIGNVSSIVTTSALQYALAYGNVTVYAAVGNITTNDNFTWSTGAKLTLESLNTIQVNNLGTMTGNVAAANNVLTLTAPIINIGTNGNLSTVPTGFVLTTGSIQTTATQSLSLYGGNTSGSFAKLTTMSGNQTILFGDTFLLESGTATGAVAELKGTNITIDSLSGGDGAMLISGSNCAGAYIDGSAIQIGATTPPISLNIEGGSSASNNEAYIGSLTTGSAITINLVGDLNLIGGSSGTNNKASIVSATGGNSKPISISARDIVLLGGAGTTNQARIASLGNLGIVSLTTQKDIVITAGSGILDSAFVTATTTNFSSGRDTIVTGGTANLAGAYIEGTSTVNGSIARFLILQGGSAPLADAQIKVTNGNISLNALTQEAQFIFRGGNIVGANNASAKVIVLQDGNVQIGNINPPNYLNLIGGSGGEDPFAELVVQGDGNIYVQTLADITYLGGIDGTLTHANAHIDGTGNITHLAGRDMNLTTGKNSPSNAYLQTANGGITVDTFRDFNMTGDCYVPNKAYLEASGQNAAVYVIIGRDLTQRGHTYIAVNNPNGVLYMQVGHTHTVADCSYVRLGDTIILPAPPPAPVVPLPVYPADEFYKYTFLYELFYRLCYFKCYDWFVFHGNSFWESTTYTDPGNVNHL